MALALIFLKIDIAKTNKNPMINACPFMQTVLDPRIKTRVAGVVLTSPAVGVEPSHPILKVRTHFGARLEWYFRTKGRPTV